MSLAQEEGPPRSGPTNPRAPANGPGEIGGQVTGAARPSPRWDPLIGLFLLGATLVAYAPVWHAGFIWDDNGHVTPADMRSLHGLWRTWTEPGATQQYYPILHSAFWLEHRLWGDAALGYHLANVVEHAAAAFLLYRILRRLALPGAVFAAAAFALHPVCVESVAWISEQKNTLSAVFCLAAALAYLRFDRGRSVAWYALAFALFMLAMATKTVTATLPATLLVIFWWRRGHLSWRRDVMPLVPWLAAGAGAGFVTAWVERTYIGAKGSAFGLGLADRFLVAARALWFYVGKVFWPSDLLFIYPRWGVNAGAPWQYLFPAAAAIAMAGLLLLRRHSRGPLAAALIYAGTLFPALGFVDVYPFVYSFVADHFQYLAAAVAISAAAGALAYGAARLPWQGRLAAAAAGACVVAVLGRLTSRQCADYVDAETLWRATVAGNPGCWMAYENLGGVLLEQGRLDQAIVQFRRALEVKPDDDGALNELGVALLQKGEVGESVGLFRRALEIEPNRAETHINIGVALLGNGRTDEAASHFQAALKLEPNNAKAHKNLALAFMRNSQWLAAADEFSRAADAEPDNAETLDSLGLALMRGGRGDRAIAPLGRALEIDPGSADAHFSLGCVMLQLGRTDQAVAHLRRAVEIRPGYAQAHENLANALLEEGRLDESAVQLRETLALEPDDAQAHNELGVLLLRQGLTDAAAAQYRRAIEIRPDFAVALVNLGNIMLKAGQAAKAADSYTRALAVEPNNARVRNNLGIALLEEGRPDEAAAQFRRALEIDPDYADAKRNLSVLGRRAGGP